MLLLHMQKMFLILVKNRFNPQKLCFLIFFFRFNQRFQFKILKPRNRNLIPLSQQIKLFRENLDVGVPERFITFTLLFKNEECHRKNVVVKRVFFPRE